jgi:Uncharacterized protein conserved in bacteria
MSFPFKESENVMVFTCRHILEGKADICYVTHDEDDGAWQFLCGQNHNESDARIVSLKNIVDIDPSVGALADMPLGCGAIRENKSSQWKGFRN